MLVNIRFTKPYKNKAIMISITAVVYSIKPKSFGLKL